jgi:hypothetical protein
VDEASMAGLVDLVLIDDLGPLGRGLILSKAALLAVARMPAAAQEAVRRRCASFPADAPCYRKRGLCKLIEASGLREVVEPLERMLCDGDDYVRKEAVALVERLRSG